MGASNHFKIRKDGVTLRTKAVITTYTVRVGDSDDGHHIDRVITVTDPAESFTITIPDGAYEGQELLITFLSDVNGVTVTAYKTTPGAGINLTAAGDYVSFEWVNDEAGWIVLAFQAT